MTAWATLAQIRQRWESAPMDDTVLQSMTNAAQLQCEAYAPTLADPATVPANYLEGLVLQVRALWVAQERDGDVIGFGDGFAVRVRPLGQDVKSLLRPPNPRPVPR